MKQVLNTTIIRFSLALIFIVSPLFVSRAVPAETIPYADLVGVWTGSQGGANHKLTKEQISELDDLYAVEPYNKNQMIKNIKIAFDLSNDKKKQMGENARQHIQKNFSKKNMLENYFKLYQKNIL